MKNHFKFQTSLRDLFQIRSVLFAFFILLIFQSSALLSQNLDIGYAEPNYDHDTNYVQTFPGFITTRLYLSRKYTDITFQDQVENFLIDYEPNTTLNLGIGGTFNGFTLNLAYGFGFLNQDKTKGTTKYLDLQSHIYLRKHVIDFFGQFYTGMYLENTTSLYPDRTDDYYLRPDISIVFVGGSYFRVFNDEKYSYSASLVQNEWQKKSAGSFLLGAKAFIMGAVSDSNMIPTFLGDTLFSSMDGVNRIRTTQFGPGIGYTHTFVIKHHFFFTLSLDLNIMISNVAYRGENLGLVEEWQVNPSVDVRMAIGYNSANSYFGLSYVEDENKMKSEDNLVHSAFSIGNVRLNYAKRFRMGPKFEEKINKYLP